MLRSFLTNVLQLGATIVVLCGGFTACANDSLSEPQFRPPMESLPASRAKYHQARQDIHERNRMDWVGIAHNKTLDDFRRELRKPGKMPLLCAYLLNLAQQEVHLPVAQRSHLSTAERALQRTTAEQVACKRDKRGQTLNALPASFPLRQYELISPAAISLTDQVGAAVLESSDSYALSYRLMPLLDQAMSLDSIDQALVLGTISTAQNSFEYWESSWTQFNQEVVAEYSPCLASALSAGTSFEDSEATCVGLQPVSLGSPHAVPFDFRLASREEIVPCGFNSAWEGMKKTAQSDADGFGGGFIGGLVTKTVKGALGGGGIAAVGKSGVTAVYVTIRIWKCAMGWTEITQKT